MTKGLLGGGVRLLLDGELEVTRRWGWGRGRGWWGWRDSYFWFVGCDVCKRTLCCWGSGGSVCKFKTFMGGRPVFITSLSKSHFLVHR